MRNFKIGTRLTLGFGLIIILLLVMTGIGAWRMIDTQQGNAMLEGRQQANALVLQWARQVEVNANQALAAANQSNPDLQDAFKQSMRESGDKADALSKQLAALIDNPQAVVLYQAALKARERYTLGRDEAFDNLGQGQYVKADQFFNEEMPRVTQAYIGDIDKLSTLQNTLVRELFADAKHNNELGITVLIAATLLALLVGPLFAFLVTRSIVRPLRHAVSLAEGVAKRDLRQRVDVQGKDEISALERALQNMVRSLQDAVGDVRSGANSIAAAAAQISTGNLDLSSRTEEQASSLAQTAATMEQLTATVRQNADNTQQANTLASAASKVASEGGTVVAEVVHTMSEINNKSKQVADILGVIDSIAFQTNILALNAAVEAARAGEQGRGFAVVASEVRALAQRSATAAKEIKTLIDASVSATTKGNEQVTRAGATMEEIVAGINRVTDIMGEINAANREQTTGIEEVNSAVTQMDDVTRQNASLVEESAAAASSLQDQADTLATLVATFQLSQTDHGASDTAHAAGAQAEPGRTAHGTPRIPSLPEKTVSPAPRRPKSTAGAAAATTAAAPKPAPALRAPEPSTEEWTEF